MLGLLILGIILHQYFWGNSAPEDTVQVSQTETVQCAGQVPNTEDKTSTIEWATFLISELFQAGMNVCHTQEQ